MYNLNYLKNAILAKLDLTGEEANARGFLNQFGIFANEAMTQICSAIKPKTTFAQFNVSADDIDKSFEMPSDFISFGADKCTCNGFECCDVDFEYGPYNTIKFFHTGEFNISYNARWYTFDINNFDGNKSLPVPVDVLDPIPSYVASQCYKVDDEVKSSIFRNEYEMLLARIDNSTYYNPMHIQIGGNW